MELHFKNIKIRCTIPATDTVTFVELLRQEILRVCSEKGGATTRDAIKIVGFETVFGNKEIDYILTLSGEIKPKALTLRPLIYFRSKKICMKDFRIIKTLGSGGFSRVYLVRSRLDGKFYAMKLM